MVRNVWSTFSQVGRWRWSLVLGLDLPEAFPLSLADLDLAGEHVAAEYWHGLPRAQLTLLSPRRAGEHVSLNPLLGRANKGKGC